MTSRYTRLLLGPLLAGLLATLVPLSAVAHHSSPSGEDYQDVVTRLERARKLVAEMERRERGLWADIATTDARRRTLEVELEELQALVDGAEHRLADSEAVLARIQSRLDVKSAELQEALQQLQETHELIQERAVRVYVSGPASLMDVLFGARSFREFVVRAQFVFHVFGNDRSRLDDIRRQKAAIARERDEIQKLRDQAAEQTAIVRREHDRVASIRNDVASRKRSLSGELADQYEDLQDVRSQKEVYLRQQAELEAESRRIAAFLRGRSGGPATVAPGGMAWPTSGPVTSGYGYRTHPIFGTKRFHSGIDIGASSGRSVVAAAPGVVVFAGQKGGYGNTVIVDHGGGVATLYAHMSSIGAGVGRSLDGRQFLGRVGCSGYCTGPHLHFEVRVDGETENPMKWLS